MLVVQAGLYEFAQFIDRIICKRHPPYRDLPLDNRLRNIIENASKEGFAEQYRIQDSNDFCLQLAMFNDEADAAYRPKLEPFRLLTGNSSISDKFLMARYSEAAAKRLHRKGEDDVLEYLCEFGSRPDRTYD